MAALSQCYFHTVITDWSYDGQAGEFISPVLIWEQPGVDKIALSPRICETEQAYEKGCALLEAGCSFSDFGTRRRRSFEAQESVVKALKTAAQDHPDSRGDLRGTSNV